MLLRRSLLSLVAAVLLGWLLVLALAPSTPPPAAPPRESVAPLAPPAVAPGEPRRARVRYGVTVEDAARTRDLRIVQLVPADVPGRVRVLALRCEPEPSSWRTAGGSRYAVWTFARPAESFALTVEADVELVPADLALVRRDVERRVGAHDELEPWLASEEFLESDDPALVARAHTAAAEDPQALAGELLGMALERLRYDGYVADAPGARGAWERGFGDCTDYTDVYVALCRAAGLPARHVVGFLLEWNDTAHHSWAEVHLGELGWVPFDPLHVELGLAALDRLEPIYLPLSRDRSDEILDGRWYWSSSNQGEPPALLATYDVLELAPVIR